MENDKGRGPDKGLPDKSLICSFFKENTFSEGLLNFQLTQEWFQLIDYCQENYFINFFQRNYSSWRFCKFPIVSGMDPDKTLWSR